MKPKNTLFLLLIFLALAAYVYFGEFKGGKPQPTPTPTVSMALEFDSNELLSVRVSASEGEAVLRRDGGGPWRLEKPVTDEADESRVTALLNRFASLRASRAITDTVSDLSVFGLATPQLVAEFELKDGRKLILNVGDKNPMGSAYYVQRNNDPTVYLVYTSNIEDLRRLITSPPRKPTPTATATVTVTPMPVPTGTSTVTP